MLILGFEMKNDEKMTGKYVYNVYRLLYFKGVNFLDIIETMYLLLIILGILSLLASVMGLSDALIVLRSEWKTKCVSNGYNKLKNDIFDNECY